MKCLNQKCDATEIESDDHFCYKCGHWTAKGYSFLKEKDNIDSITKGATFKQNNRLSILFSLLGISAIIFVVMLVIRGENLFKPFFYLKKQAFNYMYGYNTSFIKTDNQYHKKNVTSYEDAVALIKKDFSKQTVYCFNDYKVALLATEMEEKHSIPSVSFCDISLEESNKIKEVVDKIYLLFPNIKGALTNITITNASTNSEYIARFQPMYQFVNVNEDISSYNKVNKTQILLNSYYFLNEDTLHSPIEEVVGKGWYVEGATWESTIAHEFGHYISFVSFLKSKQLSNITFVTADENSLMEDTLNELNQGTYSENLVKTACDHYNLQFGTNLSVLEFAGTISDYAMAKDADGHFIADETIAEAIHDYYLHGNDMKPASREIVNRIQLAL